MSEPSLAGQWRTVLDSLDIRHPDPACSLAIDLTDASEPSLHFKATVRDTGNPTVFRVDMALQSVRLTIWPGERLAALFCSVLFIGYMTHELMELARYRGETILNPHDEPFYADHAFRCAAPSVLTWESLASSLVVVLPESYVTALIAEAR